ncbi:MAG: hypothetical protein D6B26_02505 [Spirochaetaceae bacterium]|nr:MAG: hypothetical protein D6B26_02505 [Spirochaetaceae bacterium]
MSELFNAITFPGTEDIVCQEIIDVSAGLLSHNMLTTAKGQVSWQGNPADVNKMIPSLLTVLRVMRVISSFTAVSFPEFERKTSQIPWAQILSGLKEPGSGIKIRARSFKSKLYHTSAITERLERIISTATERRFILDNNLAETPQTLIEAAFIQNQCTISISVSSADLGRRGYRLETAKAPLQENLAAVMIRSSGWDGQSPCIDPFCGSGTIPIEAALFSRQQGHLPTAIMGFDRDEGACRAAQHNLDRAKSLFNLPGSICIKHSPVSRLPENWTEDGCTGHIITNPPYGKRIQSRHDLRNLYARFGSILRNNFAGWTVTTLCPAGKDGEILLGQTGLNFITICSFSNGGLPVSIRRAQVDAEAL